MWTVQYEANELPENATPAWTTEHVPNPLVESTVEISPAGILHVIGSETVAWRRIEEFSDAVGSTVEFSLQVIVGGLLVNTSEDINIQIYNGVNGSFLFIYTNGIKLGYGDDSYAFNTTNEQHIYRITVKDSVVKVYVDGILRIEGVPFIGEGSPSIEFYASAGIENTETKWDYLYYRTDGAFAPTNIIGPFPTHFNT